MLKKRILASTMASVMALSSVSIVAFADDKVEAPKTEAVTKKQLEAYIESLDKFVEDELEDYGEAQTEKLENAIAYAENVVADRYAGNDEYTAAYQMVKSIKDNLQTYTGEQLQDLLDDYKSIIDSENELNKNKDEIWTKDSYRDFEDAYADAEDYVDSKDLADTTNAYIELQDAHEALEDMDTIKKSDFRRALKDYEAILKKKNEYQTWRRGVCTVGINKDYRGAKNADGDKVDVTDAIYVTYGELFTIIEGNPDKTVTLHKKGGEPLIDATETGSGTWLPVSTTASKTTVKQLINEAYTKFDKIESANETSDESIIKGYEVCLEAINVFNNWEVDNAKRGSKTSIESLVEDNHDAIIKGVDGTDALSYLNTTIASLTADVECSNKATTAANKTILVFSDGKLKVKDEDTLTTTDGFTADGIAGLEILIDDDGMIAVDKTSGEYDSTATEKLPVKPGDDLTALIPITSKGLKPGVITGATEADKAKKAAITQLQTALEMYEAYITEEEADAGDKDGWSTVFGSSGADVEALDDNDSISEPDGGTPEYRLIWRNAKYALDDLFPAGDAKYKKRDVEKIVDKAYELAELTGDAETFATLHQALVDVRQDAMEWLAAADVDGYKDDTKYTPKEATNTWHSGGANATTVKKAVQDAYDDLDDKLKEYPMSYGEIAELIATVAEGLDDKAYGTKADDIKLKLQTVAIGLSTLETKNETDAAFDDDREFFGYNRLNIKGNDGEKKLYKDVQALQKAMEDATAAPATSLGDINGDGFVNPTDALAILKADANVEPLSDAQKAVADYDKNGTINALDALAILKAQV